MMAYILDPTVQKFNNKKVYGFDIETYDDNKKFYCATIYYDKKRHWTFYDKDKLIAFFKTHRFRSSYVVATNLSFDFWGVMFGKEDSQNFFMISRGSDLITAKTTVKDGKFYLKKKGGHLLTFIDTLNYAKLSVSDMGKILKLPKLQKPKALGKLPANKEERQELLTYNIRDAEISKQFTEFLFEGFEDLGATPKLTIASTAMSLFRSVYLKDTYYRHRKHDLLFQFKGYYGGRTETFARGMIEDYNYYDFNSLYPSVMRDNIYPDPNTKRITYANNLEYINNYEGFSEVDISVPETQFPVLPIHHDNKLMFPTGRFRGIWTHVELRYAIEQGAIPLKVHKTMYFKKTCTPFKEFADKMYNKRLKYKEEGSKMQLITKLLMNSLYGKFGQKFENKEKIVSRHTPYEQIQKYKQVEIIGKEGQEFLRVVTDLQPAPFCIPAWAAYVTAHARIKLHKAMKQCDPVYVDTDSLITKKTMITGTGLGELELEKTIQSGVIVKPKFYAFTTHEGEHTVRLKGFGRKLKIQEFNKLLHNPTATYNKFMKFKEALRRNLLPNQIVEIKKEFSLEDDKRTWKQPFSLKFQTSTPKHIDIDDAEYKIINKENDIHETRESDRRGEIIQTRMVQDNRREKDNRSLRTVTT